MEYLQQCPRQGVNGELALFLIGECGLVQKIKYYFDLNDQYMDVGDSNEICAPTSKEDPSYYTLLEFLQQFLPKGLHQTIDDKKSQEVQLKLSEDKEVLGDMEIASTSTREFEDKEALGDMEIASTTRENRY
jgi:hypothetical protein